MRFYLVFLFVLIFFPLNGQDATKLYGHWKGIQMFQDEESYDGQTIYLPNSDFMSIEENSMKVYFYPYFKSDEFDIEVTGEEIRHKINGRRVESQFHFQHDTLVFTMYFIGKRFVKMYERTEMNPEVMKELDEFGFNPGSLQSEFELDTFHADYKIGFNHYDSLSFKPYVSIRFIGDEEISIDGSKPIKIQRGYHTIRFRYKGIDHQFSIVHSEGTQRLGIIPTSSCKCTSIVIPYIAKSWGDRIRQGLIDFENY